MTESLPSGVLKVAELLNEARIEGDSRYTLRTSAVAFAKGAEFALNIARRYLASPPPQATGAPSDTQVIAMNPYLNDEGRRALWLAAFRMAEKHHGIAAASQVEPEDKHG